MSNAPLPDYVLSFDPGGSMQTWAYALSAIRDLGDYASYHVVEAGFVPVVGEVARPDFSPLHKWLDDLRDRYWLRPSVGGFSCDLVAERYVGRGHTGSLNEFIPFHLGFWASAWQQADLGQCRFIMASQWKLKAKKWNTQGAAPFDNWWEEYYCHLLPTWELRPTKSTPRHIMDACCIGWYHWRFEKKIICLPPGILELLS